MNRYNRLKIRKQILEYAPKMQTLLPSHPAHPNGRGAIPHMYDVLKSVFECPIEEVSDTRIDDALNILKYCMDNAEQMSVATPLKAIYSPEPKPNLPATLEKFLE